MHSTPLEISPWHVWCAAVTTVATRAKATLPQCTARIEKAVKLALAGDVRLLEDGTALVVSQSNGNTIYQVVADRCDCPDAAQAPSGLCKHRLAVAIATRAYASTMQRRARSNGHTSGDQAVHHPSATGYMAIVHVVKDGFEVCLTLQKPSPEQTAFYTELDTLSHWLREHGYRPSRPVTGSQETAPHSLARPVRTALLVLLGLLLGIALLT
jgi:hypothetical protein